MSVPPDLGDGLAEGVASFFDEALNSVQTPAEYARNAGPGLDFLHPGGEMGALIRALDWSRTSIGAPETWSSALRTMVGILLANSFPMLLWWGPDYISIYNDAYRPILGRKHPWGLGRPVRECWSEIWDVLKPLIDTPFYGGPSTWVEDIELQINRSGSIEETHFTVAYSPVPDEAAPGKIGGVLATVHEITEKVVGARRGSILRDLGAPIAESKTAEDACTNAAKVFDRHRKDVPFALLYLDEPDAQRTRLVASAGMEGASARALELAGLREPASGVWPFAAARNSREMQVVTDLRARFAAVPPGTWPDPPDTGVVFPIRGNNQQQVAGFLVAGVSSRLKLDESYRDFLGLAVAQIAAAIANARAYEEERKRAEALAEIDRAKTTFFSNVSHEFRTPLTLLLGPLESVLAADESLAPETREQLETAHRNSLRLLRLVNSLLDFARIESGRVKARYAATDLASLTADLASNFRSVLGSAGLSLEVNCPTLPEPVWVDPEMWEKIVLNLLSNAFKFTFGGGVSVALEARGNQAVLIVSDTGTGIPESELEHIFERFHRVEGARGRTYEGTGIGLALIQELVKLHGGSIAVKSRIGEGTTFTVSIPFGISHLQEERLVPGNAVRASTAVRTDAYPEEARSWLAHERLARPSADIRELMANGRPEQRPRILIADDNADMREHIVRILGSGYDVTAVTNGMEALQAARETAPDIILSDVMMPELDGFALLKELRADENLRELPVIMLSARAGEEARTEGISAGADDYLTKPFSAKELVARVETTLNLQKTRREARAEIAQSEMRFRAFVTATSEVVYRMSPDWMEMRYLDGRNFIDDTANPSRSWLEKYIHPEDQARVLAAIEKAIQSKTLFELEHRVIRVDGTLGWTFSRAVPILNDDGAIVEWFGAAKDVSEHKAAKEALEAANAALMQSNADLEQFAYSASHDLQEPLRMVATYSELLKREFGGKLGSEGDEFIGYTLQGALRIQQLLKDLRTYTLVSTDRQKPAVDADADAVMDRALTNLHTAIHDSGAVITRGPMPRVRIGEIQLEQLFQNLIGNSIRYRAAETPRIHVAAEEQGSVWLFSVKDNGIGIDPQYKEHIFGMFKRLHGAAEYPGTGMGLAICQRIVERAEGESGWNRSQPGAQLFTLRSRAKSRSGKTDRKNISIVLVEDNPADASLVRRALEEHGVSGHLTLLTDGEKAITFIRTLEDPSVGCPDLAIIDLNLPRRSGREVLEAMRRNQRLLQVPAVILSSSDAENDRTGSLKLGASRYITKPTRLDDFLSIGGILRDVLEQRSS